MKISAIDLTKFSGIYKVKASGKERANHRVETFLSENENVYKISVPFDEKGKTYFYTITKDDMADEALFEQEMRKAQIPYWKASSLRHIGNKALLDKIFESDKAIQGRESWVRPR